MARSLVLEGPRNLRLQADAAPILGPRDVRVRAVAQRDQPRNRAEPVPRHLGLRRPACSTASCARSCRSTRPGRRTRRRSAMSSSGVVAEVGDDVDELSAGDLVHAGVPHREEAVLDLDVALHATYPLVAAAGRASRGSAGCSSASAWSPSWPSTTPASRSATTSRSSAWARSGCSWSSWRGWRARRASPASISSPSRRELAQRLGADAVLDPRDAGEGVGPAIKRAGRPRRGRGGRDLREHRRAARRDRRCGPGRHGWSPSASTRAARPSCASARSGTTTGSTWSRAWARGVLRTGTTRRGTASASRGPSSTCWPRAGSRSTPSRSGTSPSTGGRGLRLARRPSRRGDQGRPHLRRHQPIATRRSPVTIRHAVRRHPCGGRPCGSRLRWRRRGRWRRLR